MAECLESQAMAKQKSWEKAVPFSIRLTQTERQCLQSRASGRPLGEYIRLSLLGAETAERERKSQSVAQGRDTVGQVLALLGRSDISESLRRIAAQAEAGTLYCDEALHAELKRACEHVASIRLLLMEVLGKRTPSGPADVRQIFQEASGSGSTRP